MYECNRRCVTEEKHSGNNQDFLVVAFFLGEHMKQYKILKIFNNNVVLVLDLSSTQEAVFYNKGIGFGRKEGQVIEIDKETVEKSFISYDEEFKEVYINLLQGINHEIFGSCIDYIALAEKELGQLNPRIRLVLTDHIAFAIDRIQNKQEIVNPFVDEIKILYPQEYAIAELSQEFVFKPQNVHVSDDEIGFIAMHLYAAKKNIEAKESVKTMRLVNVLVEIIENGIGQKIGRNFDYSRLVYHLRSTVERSMENKMIKNPMINEIKNELKDSYKIAEKCANYLKANAQLDMIEDEKGFMAIHINRISQQIKK